MYSLALSLFTVLLRSFGLFIFSRGLQETALFTTMPRLARLSWRLWAGIHVPSGQEVNQPPGRDSLQVPKAPQRERAQEPGRAVCWPFCGADGFRCQFNERPGLQARRLLFIPPRMKANDPLALLISPALLPLFQASTWKLRCKAVV